MRADLRSSGFDDVSLRWSAAAPFVIVGALCIIAAGVTAAAIAPSPTRHGVWAVAYLVLVTGVSQIAIGIGQALFAGDMPTDKTIAVQLIAFNAASALVIAGTLIDRLLVTDIGGGLLLVSLIIFLTVVRGDRARGGSWLFAYRILIGLVIICIPVGLVLARVNAT